MRDNPLKIAITPELPVSDEARKISLLLAEGWDHVHLRHPGANLREMSEIIGRVDPRLHNRIVVHGYFDLVNGYNLGGIHLNSRCPAAPEGYRGAISRSCHSVDEIAASENLSYVTLSPIFDSVSKPGYRGRFSDAALRRLDSAKVPVISLGGVTPETLPLLSPYNFAGFAVLGSLPWDRSETEFIIQAKKFI